jgi:hypothetical protein
MGSSFFDAKSKSYDKKAPAKSPDEDRNARLPAITLKRIDHGTDLCPQRNGSFAVVIRAASVGSIRGFLHMVWVGSVVTFGPHPGHGAVPQTTPVVAVT